MFKLKVIFSTFILITSVITSGYADEVTNTSVNPARSTGVAVFVGNWAIAQLWLFWVVPIIGAILAGLAYRLLGRNNE